MLRWLLEVTLEQARRHLGVEPQRQRPDPAIRPTTPAPLGRFGPVTLLARGHMADPVGATSQADWNHEGRPAFADALTLIPRVVVEHLSKSLTCVACTARIELP